jgi:GT2 family glycosyltransferase
VDEEGAVRPLFAAPWSAMATSSLHAASISAIIPTIGRLDSLRRLLESLASQTVSLSEVIIADGSEGDQIAQVVKDRCWADAGLAVRSILVSPPNAVRQRQAAISESQGEFLLLLDDDVATEPACVEEMLRVMSSAEDVVGVCGDFNNQTWSRPTTAWRLYLRIFHGLHEGQWNGKVIGPLLRFGYNPVPSEPQPIEWFGTGNTMIRRRAYDLCGGFSDFFLHRCTMNEDVDLGLRLSRYGRILFCPQARMGHFHAPGGRVSPAVAAEDDLYNRYFVLHRTKGFSKGRAMRLCLVFFSIESLSNGLGAARRAKMGNTFQLLRGRSRAVLKLLALCLRGEMKAQS